MLSVKLILAEVDFLKHLAVAKHHDWLSKDHNASSVRDCTTTVFNHLCDIDGVWVFFRIVSHTEDIADDREARCELHAHRLKFSLTSPCHSYFIRNAPKYEH